MRTRCGDCNGAAWIVDFDDAGGLECMLRKEHPVVTLTTPSCSKFYPVGPYRVSGTGGQPGLLVPTNDGAQPDQLELTL